MKVLDGELKPIDVFSHFPFLMQFKKFLGSALLDLRFRIHCSSKRAFSIARGEETAANLELGGSINGISAACA
jgi:hypothetical protein